MKHPQHTKAQRPGAILKATALATLLATASAHAFDSGSTGADGALAPAANSGVVEIQLPESGILNYTTVNIPVGVTLKFKKNTLNTPVVMLASGNVTIAGTIDVSGGHGAHAGTAGNGDLGDDGVPGRSGPGGFDGGRGGSTDAATAFGGAGLGPGGGKGGITGTDGCNGTRYYKAIGGGAGHSGNGSAQTCSAIPLSDSVGRSYGNALLQPLIGGSGGGGGKGGGNFGGSGGGGGGGALLIAASGTLQLTGLIYADGGGGGLAGGVNTGGHGAGGSGGGVRLMASFLAGGGTVRTIGGCLNSAGIAGVGSPYKNVYYNATTYDNVYGAHLYACGDYGASEGRVRLEAETTTYTGKTYPAYTTSTPGPVFLSNVPSLRIASVAGSAVPAIPTGNADVVLPADVANPVTVNFETTNVPTGNTIVLKVVPASGNPIEVQSPAIAGTTSAGTTSVQVSLPGGPSVLQATTTYTVVVAMGEALSHYAQNERVDKVQLIATLGGAAPQAKLITVSGKEYTVPWSVLQIAGFSG
ncbi:MAG: hypothetical protein U1C04_10590 [Hydrogenophaga sp.]|uniref:hypothetical protein n=1 Tax=Hydrogenophaga sp. TaxID=1904254 RepID=UPI002ABC84EE|nr:hypothetical protein [Hydrogenophaga sp.]MDZ4281206.1 hypothetical protein [Hydrogenophaga sp.]